MSKEILSKVADLLMGGADFHSRMVDYYTFLGLPCFSECQCHHMEEELENYHKFLTHVCDTHKILLKYTYKPLPEVIPADFYSKSAMEVDEQMIKTHLKLSLEKWLKWEMATKEKLECYAEELLSHHCHADYHYVRELIEDVVCEIYNVECLIQEMKKVSYDMERVKDLKHHLMP